MTSAWIDVDDLLDRIADRFDVKITQDDREALNNDYELGDVDDFVSRLDRITGR